MTLDEAIEHLKYAIKNSNYCANCGAKMVKE